MIPRILKPRFLKLGLLAMATAWPLGSLADDHESRPAWIWPATVDRGAASAASFALDFPVDPDPASVSLRITSDFAAFEVHLNGELLHEAEAYDPVVEIDLRPGIVGGGNRLAIRARGVEGPSALAAEIRVEMPGGEVTRLGSGPDWGEDLVSLGEVIPERWDLNSLPEISPVAEYNQWKEAKAGTTERLSPLPPGFEIQRIHAATGDEGSWVSLAIDDQGRLILGREQKGLLRMTLSEAGNGDAVEEVELINGTLEECRGLAWKDGTLYANANRSLALYRLRDTTGDDQFDEVTLLQRTEGKTGHGRNDLVIGPDDRVHAIHGDVVLVPEESQKLTVPERGAPLELGHWVSTSETGEGWRIHNQGLRNPYGIDFNPDGEPFTYDADNEGDVGLPFYRPTRINHLVSGANYGWHQDRGNTRNLTTWAPDSVPTTFDVGRGSPTAVKFGTRSQFPAEYREALFALDWAYGRIVAVALEPRGASYYGSGSVFIEGRPLNVTDLDFAPDGSMLFITGGRKTQSALFRVRYVGDPKERSPLPEQARARRGFSAAARERRRQLEHYHGNPETPDFEAAWNSLGDPDPWIRQAARVGVETQALERWRKRALAAELDLQGLHALLALVRQGEIPADLEAVAIRLESADWKIDAWGRDERLALLRILEIIAGSPEGPGISPATGRRLLPWAESVSDPVRREAIRILVAAGVPEAVPLGLRLAADAEDQLERLHYLEMLSDASTGWTDSNREVYLQALVHAKRLSFGDRFMAGFFQAVEGNAMGRLPDKAMRERWAILLNEDPAPLPPVTSRPPVRQWKLADFGKADLEPGEEAADLERGRRMYDAALCSRCHVAGDHGRPVGPDLTQVASRFSRHDLLEAILEPSKVVAEVHRNTLIETRDGEIIQGRIVQDDFRKSLLFVAQDPFQPTRLTEVNKAEIASSRESPVSPMPPGLLDSLEREEILDLLAWLESRAETR